MEDGDDEEDVEDEDLEEEEEDDDEEEDSEVISPTMIPGLVYIRCRDGLEMDFAGYVVYR